MQRCALTVVLQALVQRQTAALLGMPDLQAPRSPQALRALGVSKVTAGVAAAGVAGARVALEPSGSLPGTVPGSSAASGALASRRLAGLCRAAVEVHVRARRCGGALGHDLAFAELFSGPGAPLTFAVVERLSGSVGL